jgi:hypothetical protein
MTTTSLFLVVIFCFDKLLIQEYVIHALTYQLEISVNRKKEKHFDQSNYHKSSWNAEQEKFLLMTTKCLVIVVIFCIDTLLIQEYVNTCIKL